MLNVILIICLLLMLAASLCAVMFRSMLKSAIFLAASSAFLAIALFIMNVYWAAIVELSVCSGLITVVFVSVISLATTDRRGEERSKAHHQRYAPLPFLLIFTGICLGAVFMLSHFRVNFNPVELAGFDEFKETFWQTRQVDILGQIIIILTGAFAVVVLFKGRGKG